MANVLTCAKIRPEGKGDALARCSGAGGGSDAGGAGLHRVSPHRSTRTRTSSSSTNSTRTTPPSMPSQAPHLAAYASVASAKAYGRQGEVEIFRSSPTRLSARK